jgi:VIT1/CCC1 family predicted Fe2+/Mn2+ transporter
MIGIRNFIRANLDPAGRLSEILFGVIMALGFTGAVRLGQEEPDNRALFLGILGCNIAWGIVDAIMYVLGAMYDRGRRARVVRGVLEAPSEDEAMRRVGEELDDRLAPLTTAEERRQVYRWVIEIARRGAREPVRLRREDLLGGAAAGAVVVLATLPIVAPYLLFRDPHLAVRLSHLTGVTLLFLLGMAWGKTAGGSPFWIGAGMALVGMALAGVTILLGG